MSIIFSHDLPYETALEKCKLTTLKDRREKMCLNFINNMKKDNHKLHHLMPEKRECSYNLRRPVQYNVPKLKTNRAEGSLINWFLTKQLK